MPDGASTAVRGMQKASILGRKESKKKQRRKVQSSLSLALKPATRAHDSDTLVHDNLANGKVPRDPRFGSLIVGDFVFVDTGAGL